MGLANYTICNQYDEVEPNLVRPLTANQVIRLTPGCAGSSPALGTIKESNEVPQGLKPLVGLRVSSQLIS